MHAGMCKQQLSRAPGDGKSYAYTQRASRGRLSPQSFAGDDVSSGRKMTHCFVRDTLLMRDLPSNGSVRTWVKLKPTISDWRDSHRGEQKRPDQAGLYCSILFAIGPRAWHRPASARYTPYDGEIFASIHLDNIGGLAATISGFSELLASPATLR